MKTITTKISKISYNKLERILSVRLFENANVALEHVVENYNASCSLTKGEKYLKMVVGATNGITTKEAREFSARIKENDGRIAEALVVRSVALKIIATFYINFNKPKVPTRIFASEERAIEWLKSYLYLTETDNELSFAGSSFTKII